MQQHDERRIPLEFEPAATPSERSFWATFLDLFRIRRNAQDDRRAQAVERNHTERQLAAKRLLRQPGATDEQVALALRVLGRAGSGSTGPAKRTVRFGGSES